MDTKLIETAIAVHTYKSYSEAAYQISLSPSAVSKHIVQLESELGVRLFLTLFISSRKARNLFLFFIPLSTSIIPF